MYKKPYFWVRPSLPNRRICVYNWRVRQTEYNIFYKGLHLPATDIGASWLSQDPATYDLIFDAECEAERILEYGALSTTIPAPVVREDVLAILQDVCPDDFQAFPVIIQGVNPKIPPFELTNYFLINVTNISGQLDEELCDGKINYEIHHSAIKYTILKEDHMEGHHLSRLKGEKIHVIVSPYLRQRLMKSKIWGLKFEKDGAEKRLRHLAMDAQTA